MFLGLVFLACLLTVPLARGRLTALADLQLRRPWLAIAGIGVQIMIISVIPAGTAGLHEAVHMGSYALLGAFVWSNRRVPGVPLIMLGGLLNFIAIAANGGVMPASESALRAAGLDVRSGEFANSDLVRDAHVGFLGDVFAIPAGWPGANVFSVGDGLMVLGAFLVLHAATGSRLFAARETPRPRDQVAPTAPAPPVPRAR
jgi:hypothetical protein